MTTIQDIADKLGISKGTVSKALNNAPDISETLQKQILETAVELGYTKLRRYKNSAKRLCILVQKDFIQYEEPHHFAYDIVMGFRQMAEPEGYEVEIVSVNAESQRAESYDVFMLQNDYSASFVLGFSLNDPWMEDFRTTRTPTVLYDNQIHDNPSIAYIGIDNVEGMELAVSHLRELGHEKIGYLSSALESHIMQVRYNAFFQALRRHGLPDNPELAGCSFFLSECMDRHLPRLLDMGVTAIVCGQDTIANAALVQCQQLGYSIPGAVSIIGFDDIPICPYTSPPLTTVNVPKEYMGKLAAERMLTILSEKEFHPIKLEVCTQLVKRGSV